MIKILHLIESLSIYGGTPRKLLSLIKESDKTGIEHVFITYQKSPDLNPFIKHGAIINHIETTSILKLINTTRKIIDSYNISVVCTHFTRPLLIGYFCSKVLMNKPWIHNEHSSAYYRKGMGLILSKLCLPKADIVICNSHHTADSIKNSYAINPSKLRVIHNPVEKRVVNTSRINTRKKLGISSDDILIGHVGGMIESRDQQTLIIAFSDLALTQSNLYLVLIGEGPVSQQLKSLVSDLELNNKIIFIGYTDAIGDYLDSMDIYVNPTLDEGFGIAVVEAMLAKLPVVLSNCGAHPELIIDNESGILYEGKNKDMLRLKLQALIDDTNLRMTIGENASNRAQQLFSPTRYAAEYLNTVLSIAS